MGSMMYLGHSAFHLEDDEGRSVLIDPFISDNPSAEAEPDHFSPLTILLTHAHNDHVGDTVEIAQRTGAKVIATHELANWLTRSGVENAVGGNHGGTIAFEGGTAKFVPAWHTSSFDTGDGVVAPGIPAGLVVRFGGKTFYFAGDTCLFSDMKLIGEEGLDFAILPIGDHFTMGPVDAARAVRFLEPSVVIPCHYNTFPPIEQDAEEFKRRVQSETNASCLVLDPGQSTDF
jgi:L-ascorbate metabolism protein UlaG (beta-lactamase superfamily)